MIKFTILCILVFMIMGCTNDDSSTGGYTGIKSPIKITVENGKEITIASLSSAGAGSNAGSEGNFDSDTLSKPIAKARRKARSIAYQADTINNNIVNGDCGGTETVIINFDQDTGNFSGEITSVDFCDSEADEIVNGNLNLTGTIDLVTEDLSMDFAFSNLSFISRDGSESASITGTGKIKSIDDIVSFTLNATIKDNILNEEYFLENFIFTTTEITSDFGLYLHTLEELNGRIYQATKGYVDFDTTIPFKINYNDGLDIPPSEGSVVLSGEGGSNLTLSAVNGDQYELTIDENGDGTIDDTQTGLWNSLDLGILFE